MTNKSGSRGLLSGRLGPLIVVAVVTGLLVLVACFMVWHTLGGGAWFSEVKVVEAILVSPKRLDLEVASCNGSPRASFFETVDHVRVKVKAFSTPLRGGEDCLDLVSIYLLEPLGDRIVIDRHTGQILEVIPVIR